MAVVSTVIGPIDTSRLGATLMHEHVFVLSTEISQNFPEVWSDEEKRVNDAIARLNELKSRGVDTIVDLTVIGLGRYIPRIQRIASQTEINIIVATGLYTYNDVPMYFHFRGPGTELGGPELMTDMFVRDIEEGIAQLRSRASKVEIHWHIVVGIQAGGDDYVDFGLRGDPLDPRYVTSQSDYGQIYDSRNATESLLVAEPWALTRGGGRSVNSRANVSTMGISWLRRYLNQALLTGLVILFFRFLSIESGHEPFRLDPHGADQGGKHNAR